MPVFLPTPQRFTSLSPEELIAFFRSNIQTYLGVLLIVVHNPGRVFEVAHAAYADETEIVLRINEGFIPIQRFIELPEMRIELPGIAERLGLIVPPNRPFDFELTAAREVLFHVLRTDGGIRANIELGMLDAGDDYVDERYVELEPHIPPVLQALYERFAREVPPGYVDAVVEDVERRFEENTIGAPTEEILQGVLDDFIAARRTPYDVRGDSLHSDI